jgi:acetyl-CoA decarbonylase/synthase complex subunit gamma
MSELSGLQIFKYLPAAKKLPEGNCKKCGFATCMAFALNLAKNQTKIELCPYISENLKEIFEQGMKKPQKEVFLGQKEKVLIGGENVLFRHDKTFINKTAIGIVLDVTKSNWEEQLKRIIDFEITRINETFKIDLIYLKGNIKSELLQKLEKLNLAYIFQDDLKDIIEVKEEQVFDTIKTLTEIRKKAILEKDENYSNPVMIYFKSEKNMLKLMAKASFYLCKYANLIIFEDFNEALISTLMTLRQNIYTDPQKPLQIESKVYEFNNADENSLIFLTTNFALTYFAVANEIEALNIPAYIVVTPSEGMSVLTAWSAEKFTAQIVAKTIKDFNLAAKVKNKKIIIPGLLADMKEEIEEVLPEFEIIIGPNEAYLLGDFIKLLCNS